MSLLEALAVAMAGVCAGAINTVVGSGTLITFPVLLAVGFPPVAANVSNTVGLVPGSISGAIGYRRELDGQRHRVRRLALPAVLGGLSGGVLLLVLPAEAFRMIVPAFIAIALVLVVAQPRLGGLVARREQGHGPAGRRSTWGAVLGTGMYGGYFGAAQGILLIAILGLAVDDDLQRVNALKNVLAGLVNAVAAVLFVLIAPVEWGPVLLIACGSIVGAQLGARVGRRLPPPVLRAVVVLVGIAAIGQLVAG